ncbi:mannosyl-oligosaccharide 1,2-alpha-mannosidase IA-like [Macrosteles quadrilineatus]|uniref:mannosyl-oligosaccharide 1,2-alpha-mannosidase IA-like n=1 Tax=Macrosteles quadrilineatus TaxID=74068 RepID=UPI0023E0AB27|nr:mannosyl-oligosaccharide 1,2-alpha-mannosidase IA-like [Macrosteles quadrilineatus]
MDLAYSGSEEESEYICQSALNSDNVYVYMAPQGPMSPENQHQTRAVSYLEIIAEKREHVYEYIEYGTAKPKEKFELNKYSKVIKRTLLSICVLLGIVALLVLVVFLFRLMDRWQREKTMEGSREEANKEEIQNEIIFRLNITRPIDRASFVRNMTREAWNAYVQHAWGSGALKPLTKEADDSTTVGETIVSSMSTLWVMEMYEEFDRGKQWVESELHRLTNTTADVLVYIIIVNYLGGLLSCFALTGDEVFLNKSFEITDMILPALNYSVGNGK